MHEPGFVKDFEIRKIIFGLSALIKTPQNELPPMLSEKLPMIMTNLAYFTIRTH